MKKSFLMLMVIIALCISGILHHTVVLQPEHGSQCYVVDEDDEKNPNSNNKYKLNCIRPHSFLS